MRRVVIMGAGGRDFHNFSVVFRDDPECRVVAFTAAQIPGIDERTYPPSLAGARYPTGIPIVPEHDLAEIVRRNNVDEVVFAYSDLSHEDVMHRASISLAAGADFTLLGPRSTMLQCPRPVVAVCATRTGAGKSQTSRRIGRMLLDAGLRVALVRHPMPYGDSGGSCSRSRTISLWSTGLALTATTAFVPDSWDRYTSGTRCLHVVS